MGNRTMKSALTALVCFSTLWFVVPGSSAENQETQQQTIEKGRRVFSGSCGMAYCHGADAVGGGGPKLRDREFSADTLTKVITEGLPGTGMPAFKASLKKEQIAQVVSFLISVNKEIKSAQSRIDPHFAPNSGGGAGTETVTTATPPLTPASTAVTLASFPGFKTAIAGDVAAGETIFFDSSETGNCRVCHTVQGRGGKVASDLDRLSSLPPREVFFRILAPANSSKEKYGLLTLKLKTGEQITGVKRDEEKDSIRLYDLSSLPPVSRQFLKSEIAGSTQAEAAGCPGNYASKYTLKQLLDLVAFLKTTDASKPAIVRLQDLF